MQDIGLCMKCMKPNTSEKCIHCGYVKGSQQKCNHCLPESSVLNDRYVVGCLLGSGGFANTYIAYDSLFERKVAIKEYLPGQIAYRSESDHSVMVSNSRNTDAFEAGKEKFMQEAKILHSLKAEKGIVDVIDYFKAYNTAYIVTEYLECVTLGEYMDCRSEGRLPEQEAMEKLLPVFDILDTVHKKGLLHRDISPENILISKNSVKLIDFGASRKFSEETVTKTIILKHGYAPPEQYSTKGRQGEWSDVYSLGATLYKCLTGITPPEAFGRMLGEKVKTFRECGIDSPNEDAIMKSMSLNISDRYKSVAEFKRHLMGGKGQRPKQAGGMGDMPFHSGTHQPEKTIKYPDPVPVRFRDPNLERMIRIELNQPEGEILESNLARIERLELYNSNIVSLEGLQHAKGLRRLNISGNDIKDLSPLTSLGNLTVIEAYVLPLSDISPLGNISTLREIYVCSNHLLSDISALGNLPNLEVLNINNTAVSDIRVLSKLVNLTALYASRTRISDISALTHCRKLKRLGCRGNPITDYSPLKNLPLLEHADIDAVINISKERQENEFTS